MLSNRYGSQCLIAARRGNERTLGACDITLTVGPVGETGGAMRRDGSRWVLAGTVSRVVAVACPVCAALADSDRWQESAPQARTAGASADEGL